MGMALTSRQGEFLQLLADGHRAVDICKVTSWSREVVFRELCKARKKLKAKTNIHAVVIFLQERK
jgi:DNA-binding NarL/FixJ family response regulator